MGILLEAEYKDVLAGRTAPWTGLKRAFSAGGNSAGTANPLADEAGAGAAGPDGRRTGGGSQLTYEAMNRDSGARCAAAPTHSA